MLSLLMAFFKKKFLTNASLLLPNVPDYYRQRKMQENK